jgi:hypothetical protein
MKNRIAIFILVSVVLIMALSACGAIKDVSKVNDLGNSFMTALKNGDADSSWAMLTASVQKEVGDTTAWKEFVTPRNFSDWKITNTQVNDASAQIDGTAALGADKYDIVLVFDKVDDAWLISGINMTKQE